jgi:hypothetical protein
MASTLVSTILIAIASSNSSLSSEELPILLGLHLCGWPEVPTVSI